MKEGRVVTIQALSVRLFGLANMAGEGGCGRGVRSSGVPAVAVFGHATAQSGSGLWSRTNRPFPRPPPPCRALYFFLCVPFVVLCLV